jgi:hypothetical protein
MDGVTTPEAAGPETAAPGAGWPPMVAFAQPRAPERGRRRRVLTAVAVAWALALVGTGIWYSFHGSPTVRDQTTIAQAQPHVDDAIAQVLAAAGGDPVPAVSAYQKSADCQVTPVRAGAKYQRAVRLYTAVGKEADLLGRIAARLPGRYHAKVRGPGLSGDAGFYVLLTGGVEQPGVVKIVASTGCRPVGHQPASDPSARPAPGDRMAIDPVLVALHAGTVRWSTHRLPCGVRTVEAVTVSGVGSLRAALRPAGAPVVSGDDALAYRDSGAAVAAQRSGDVLTVTATTGSCQ